MGLLAAFTGRQEERNARRYRELIRKEAKIGGELFGPVAIGARREFFCLDEYTWVWHEEWTDQAGQHHAVTTRYDVRPQGVLKAQDGQPYHYITRDEARSFYKAAKLYNKRIRHELYGKQD
ncbi:MAG TPA: hypothetical protein VGO07_06060 [Candidatus Saccharimonadales bacterium]|jgi:hypothetical protein|nr:hypothetical protein [Candidatus Saccharimonadales bacterium]